MKHSTLSYVFMKIYKFYPCSTCAFFAFVADVLFCPLQDEVVPEAVASIEVSEWELINKKG